MPIWDFLTKSHKDTFQEAVRPYIDELSPLWTFPDDWFSLQAQVIHVMNHPGVKRAIREHKVSVETAKVIVEHHIKQGWGIK